jgi:TonB family protein
MVLVQLLFFIGVAQTSADLDWRWDRDHAGCGLRQEVNSGGDAVQVGMTPANGQTAVTIFDRGAGKLPEGTLRGGSISFAPGENMHAEIYVSRDSSGIRTISAFTDDRNALDKFSHSSAVEISHEKLGTVKAVVRSAAAAANALSQCEDRKFREWEIDPVTWRALKSSPIPLKPIFELLSPYDYPSLAAAYGVEGTVIVRLDVTPNGKVAACKSLNPTRYKGFETSVCNVMKKSARFQPARGAEGNPASAPYVFIVRFTKG